MIRTLVEIILIQLYQLETASNDDVNEDLSVNIMEQSAASLQRLSVNDTKIFLEIVTTLAKLEANQSRKEYLQDFGKNFGIVDSLA